VKKVMLPALWKCFGGEDAYGVKHLLTLFDSFEE